MKNPQTPQYPQSTPKVSSAATESATDISTNEPITNAPTADTSSATDTSSTLSTKTASSSDTTPQKDPHTSASPSSLEESRYVFRFDSLESWKTLLSPMRIWKSTPTTYLKLLWILWIISFILVLIRPYAYIGLWLSLFIIASSCVVAFRRRSKRAIKRIYLVLGILAVLVAFISMPQIGLARAKNSTKQEKKCTDTSQQCTTKKS